MDQTYSCKFYNHWVRSLCARAWPYMSNSDNTSLLYKLLGIGQNQCIMMSKNLITPEVCDRKLGGDDCVDCEKESYGIYLFKNIPDVEMKLCKTT